MKPPLDGHKESLIRTRIKFKISQKKKKKKFLKGFYFKKQRSDAIQY